MSVIYDKIIEPVVSVCMEVYNHGPFLRQSIEGVLMQQGDIFFELVIGEDCSKDSSREICEEFAGKYPEIIRLLPSEKNLGMEANFTRILQACTGKYIAICEGDDFWTDPYKLKKQVDFMENNASCSACFTNAEVLNELDSSRRIYLKGLKEGYVPAETSILRGGALYPTASIIFLKSPLRFEIFMEIKELACDNLLILILAMNGDVYYMNQLTCVYRVWAGGVYTSTINDPEKTITRKRRTVLGLKKLLKTTMKPFREYMRDRISSESLFVLVNDGFFKNIQYLINLNVKDTMRVFIYKLKKIRILE